MSSGEIALSGKPDEVEIWESGRLFEALPKIHAAIPMAEEREEAGLGFHHQKVRGVKRLWEKEQGNEKNTVTDSFCKGENNGQIK